MRHRLLFSLLALLLIVPSAIVPSAVTAQNATPSANTPGQQSAFAVGVDQPAYAFTPGGTPFAELRVLDVFEPGDDDRNSPLVAFRVSAIADVPVQFEQSAFSVRSTSGMTDRLTLSSDSESSQRSSSDITTVAPGESIELVGSSWYASEGGVSLLMWDVSYTSIVAIDLSDDAIFGTDGPTSQSVDGEDVSATVTTGELFIPTNPGVVSSRVPAGSRTLGISFDVENTGDTKLSLNTYNASIIDNTGFRWQLESYDLTRNAEALQEYMIPAGEQDTLAFPFLLPFDRTPAFLVMDVQYGHIVYLNISDLEATELAPEPVASPIASDIPSEPAPIQHAGCGAPATMSDSSGNLVGTISCGEPVRDFTDYIDSSAPPAGMMYMFYPITVTNVSAENLSSPRPTLIATDGTAYAPTRVPVTSASDIIPVDSTVSFPPNSVVTAWYAYMVPESIEPAMLVAGNGASILVFDDSDASKPNNGFLTSNDASARVTIAAIERPTEGWGDTVLTVRVGNTGEEPMSMPAFDPTITLANGSRPYTSGTTQSVGTPSAEPVPVSESTTPPLLLPGETVTLSITYSGDTLPDPIFMLMSFESTDRETLYAVPVFIDLSLLN